MTGVPAVLAALLDSAPIRSAGCWEAFLAEYSDLILYAIRRTERDQDDAGDAYAYVLERLRRDDFRRLRGFEPGGAAKFTTWLVVVVRRLVIDLKRSRSGPAAQPNDERAQLRNLVSAVSDLSRLPDSSMPNPIRRIGKDQAMDALETAVEGLSARDRLLIVVRFEDGLTARAIAESMSFPSQFHVYRRLKKVLSQMRSELESAGIRSAEG